jgi:signal transduction histidine kinase
MRWFPRSLFVRLFLIVLGGVLLAILLTTTLARRDRATLIEEFRERTALGYLTNAIRVLATLPPQARISASNALPSNEWFIDFGSIAEEPWGEVTPTFAAAIANRLGRIARVEEAWLERLDDCDEEAGDCRRGAHTALVRVRFQDGQAALIGYSIMPRGHSQGPQPLGFWSRVAIFIAVMTAVLWLVVRLALRPLHLMAQAAEDFGRDIAAHSPMDVSGPTEVRRAAQVFNAMQERILTYMAERTQILSAVTHDLKTPLTRMRLRLEHCTDEPLKERLLGDITAMQSLVDEGLELARSLDTSETTMPIDLGALLESLCDDAAEAGQPVRCDVSRGQGALVVGKPNALRRVFTNLIDNAVKYGHYAHVSLDRRNGTARVRVRDGGDGVPEEHLSDVLKPFVRLEASRSRDTGGTGLGLAIAVNLLKSQQGTLTLRNLPQGGLEATVALPVSSMTKQG